MIHLDSDTYTGYLLLLIISGFTFLSRKAAPKDESKSNNEGEGNRKKPFHPPTATGS